MQKMSFEMQRKQEAKTAALQDTAQELKGNPLQAVFDYFKGGPPKQELYSGEGMVSCGGHEATACSACVGTNGMGPVMCHGQCEWKNHECITLAEVDTSVTCGGHRAAECGACGDNYLFCNGDCEWSKWMNTCAYKGKFVSEAKRPDDEQAWLESVINGKSWKDFVPSPKSKEQRKKEEEEDKAKSEERKETERKRQEEEEEQMLSRSGEKAKQEQKKLLEEERMNQEEEEKV